VVERAPRIVGYVSCQIAILDRLVEIQLPGDDEVVVFDVMASKLVLKVVSLIANSLIRSGDDYLLLVPIL
jgi:hypothetical protein